MTIKRLGENLFEVRSFWLRRGTVVQAILEIQTKYNKTITSTCTCVGWKDSLVIATS